MACNTEVIFLQAPVPYSRRLVQVWPQQRHCIKDFYIVKLKGTTSENAEYQETPMILLYVFTF